MASMLSRVAPEDPLLIVPDLFERIAGRGEGIALVDGRYVTTDGHSAVLFLSTTKSSSDVTAQRPFLDARGQLCLNGVVFTVPELEAKEVDALVGEIGRQHAVRAAREPGEHRARSVGVRGLAEHVVAEHHFGVGGEHDRVRRRRHLHESGAGLLARDAAHVVLGRLAGRAHLVDARVEHAETVTELLEQLAAARRLRGEEEQGGSIRFDVVAA